MLSSSTHHDTRDRIHPERNLEKKTFLLQPFFSFGAGNILHHFVFFALLTTTLMNTYI